MKTEMFFVPFSKKLSLLEVQEIVCDTIFEGSFEAQRKGENPITHYRISTQLTRCRQDSIKK